MHSNWFALATILNDDPSVISSSSDPSRWLCIFKSHAVSVLWPWEIKEQAPWARTLSTQASLSWKISHSHYSVCFACYEGRFLRRLYICVEAEVHWLSVSFQLPHLQHSAHPVTSKLMLLYFAIQVQWCVICSASWNAILRLISAFCLVTLVHNIFTLNLYLSNGWVHADTTNSWTMKHAFKKLMKR